MVTSWLIKNWHMSSVIVDAFRYHHEPLEKIKEAFPLVKIVYLGNLLYEKAVINENSGDGKEIT